MGTVATSLPPTVALNCVQVPSEGQQASPGKQRHDGDTLEVSARAWAAPKIAACTSDENFILLSGGECNPRCEVCGCRWACTGLRAAALRVHTGIHTRQLRITRAPFLVPLRGLEPPVRETKQDGRPLVRRPRRR